MTIAWTYDHVRHIDLERTSRVPLITAAEAEKPFPGLISWDMWPVQSVDGGIADVGGRELWMALAAPDRGDPNLRHFDAKIRLLERVDGAWRDLGNVLPDMDVPYEREWAGSARFDGTTMSLYFTGAGVSTTQRGYQQRLYESHAILGNDRLPRDWTAPMSSVTGWGEHYAPADAHDGEAGKIKAFRDPAHFRDPADGKDYLIFTASLAVSSSDYNGAIGVARKDGDLWTLLPPIIHADGVNNELERAHVVAHQGRYYAFWSTQRGTFSPDLRHAPTGLYGMVADELFGDYRPLNGSGLVLANPDQEPMQTYSWFVATDLSVSSFVDFWGLNGQPLPSVDVEAARHFSGTAAPMLQLAVRGVRTRLVE